jgi:hypothetical protein
MNIIPDPVEAQKLRALYDGNPVIDAAELSLRSRGAGDVRDAVRLLEAWQAPELSQRERTAVLARFVPDPADRCAVCDATVEYVTGTPTRRAPSR